jgi:hypothetical protein
VRQGSRDFRTESAKWNLREFIQPMKSTLLALTLLLKRPFAMSIADRNQKQTKKEQKAIIVC